MNGKGVVFTGRNLVRYQEVDIPEPQADEVVIDVEHSWISIGTEASFLKGERIAGETATRKGDILPFPHINGYQKVGKVIQLGVGITDLRAGDRVFATMSRVNGMIFAEGGHVNPAVTRRDQVWKLPDGIPGIAYSGLVLAQVGYNCGIRAQVRPGDAAVVIGDGLVGQWAAQTLLHRGADVTVLGRHEERLDLLHGKVKKINSRLHSPVERLRCHYSDIAVVVDTVGSLQTFFELLPIMRHNSHLVSAGFLGSNGQIDIQTLREKEITLHCPSGWNKDRMDETLRGITEGWLQTTPLITHRFPVEQAEQAWKMILDPKQPCLGIVLDW